MPDSRLAICSKGVIASSMCPLKSRRNEMDLRINGLRSATSSDDGNAHDANVLARTTAAAAAAVKHEAHAKARAIAIPSGPQTKQTRDAALQSH